MHFIQGDADSLTWAISSNPNRGPEQLFEEVIKDQWFFDRYKDCVFSENGQKYILHIGVEKYGQNCIALLPKNYIINNEIVLKGVILNQNPWINGQSFEDCINKGTIATAINTTLVQKKGTMSRLKMEKNAVMGSHTKMIYGLMRLKLDARIAGGLPCRTNKMKTEQAEKYNATLKRAGSIRSQDSNRLYVTEQIQRINQPQKPLSLFPFQSKIKYYEKINKVKITQQTQIKDIKAKPLNKLQHPYFPPKLGSWEIDLGFGVNSVTRRRQHYLFDININTKYLVVFPLIVDEKNATYILAALKKLINYIDANNIRGDGETRFKANIIRQFCEDNKISLYFIGSPFTQQNIVVDSVIHTIRNGIQRQEFRASANDLQLLLIRRLQKTIITKLQDFLQISEIIDRYNQPNIQ
ncbi:MAG: hypothetical protein EZS28_003949 [Streblomastix strix]|uniref:Integrase catalytic domain-containing protein n=1 Tax=Streblomastix strix TaxID=222440 RepID=A0A5J4WZS4_9EUKA|nr:MAG: hypothetical protein EZS28_003949 [Streblomastix strix]